MPNPEITGRKPERLLILEKKKNLRGKWITQTKFYLHLYSLPDSNYLIKHLSAFVLLFLVFPNRLQRLSGQELHVMLLPLPWQ